MNHIAIFNALNEDFGGEIALSVCQINAIHLSQKIKQKDIEIPGHLVKRVTSKAKKLLWELSDEDFALSMILWDLIYDWEIGQTCHGLGGCEKKTFKELFDAKQANK